MSTIASELRRLRRENVRLNRRLALAEMPGKVVARDPATRRVRLDLGPDPETGAAIRSPWVRVASSLGTGGTKGFRLPDLGKAMSLRSASGVVGADSVAHHGAFDATENTHPDTPADDALVLERGDGRIVLSGDGIMLTKGEATVRLSAEGIDVTVGTQGFRLDGQALAMRGTFKAKNGSRPAHFKGGRDSRGDTTLDGNPDLLVWASP